MRRAVFLLASLLACDGGDDDGQLPPDAGAVDAGDAGLMTDGGAPDVGPIDAGPYPCDPLTATSSRAAAATTGRVDVIDYDYYDEIDGQRSRVRNAGVNFLTGNIPAYPVTTAGLYPALGVDECVVRDFAPNTMNLGPTRNIGRRLTITNGAGDKQIDLVRMVDRDGVGYDWATQQDLLDFFDPEYLAFDEPWTYATDGDELANIRPASATVEGFDDFALVEPAVSSSSTAVAMSAAGAVFTWTSTGTKGIMTVELGRATSPQGDARVVICRVEDDGSFVVPAAVLTQFAPPQEFGVLISRAAVAPFCNEGVQLGAIVHVLAYIGLGTL